jgi:LuxR family transcriptional regulator, maltose regulon positive regulatory protein
MVQRTLTTQDDMPESGDGLGAPGHIIQRPRLTKILDETEARIILLCAPAGYGKTTLARQWVATRSEPVLWYSGGPAMADVAALAVDLAELFAGSDSVVADQLRTRAARAEPPRNLARALAESAPPATSLVVLDDVHYAQSGTDADDLLGEIVASTKFRLILTARERPPWVTPRMLVYGEALEVGPGDLALTDSEAFTVLPDSESVVAQARGWPALIGLAAAREIRDDLQTNLSPFELYTFVASELFATADQPMRGALFRLALGGDAAPEVATELLGADLEGILTSICSRGFAVRETTGWISIHPLIRSFLLEQLAKAQCRDIIAADVIAALHRHRYWDECLTALEQFSDPAAAAGALTDALDELLRSGRIQTVHRWTELASQSGFTNPIFRLATAEVALRQGRPVEALAMAAHVARSFSGDLAARAHLAAARGAHQAGDLVATVENAVSAERLAVNPALKTEALWIAGASAYERDPARMREFTERLERVRDQRPEHGLRVLCSRMFTILATPGSFRDALALAEQSAALAASARDPLLRTNALHMRAHLLRVVGEYEEALDAAEAVAEEARRAGLDFVLDHVLLIRAAALIGTRSIRAAKEVLREVEKLPSTHIHANAAIAKARLRIATGDLRSAAVTLAETIELPTLGMQGEFHAFRALVSACLGQTDEAEEAVKEATNPPRGQYAEVAGILNLVRAILQIQREPDPRDATRAVRRSYEIGNCDMLVTACRAYPALAQLAVAGGAKRELEKVFSNSRDTDLGRRAGLAMPREYRRGEGLSGREAAVYELLVQGRSNAEIAKTLFISESTAKVHIRHIFDKLGVHSRAEAAAVGWTPERD